MYKQESSYSHKADDIIRKFGMSIPFIVIAYGIFIQLGFIKSTNNSGLLVFGLITLGWFILGIIQFTKPSYSPLQSFLRLSADHFLAGLSCIFITNSILVLWPILMMATYIFFGNPGIKYNILAFILITIIELFIHINDLQYIYITIAVAGTVIITSLSLIKISRTHEIKQAKLYNSQLKESMERNRIATIVNNLTDAIISTDLNGIIKVYNASSLSLLDTNLSLNGHSISKILPLIDKDEKPFKILDEIKKLTTIIQRDDLIYTYKNGEQMRVLLTCTPIKRGYSNTKKTEIHDGYIIIFRDITRQKNLEEERDEFISVASHELRTPIAIAEGTISNVLKMMEYPDITTDMLKNAISIAHEQVVFLATMVNDLAALSRAERGTDDDAIDLDVKELTNDLMSRYLADANRKKIQLNLDISPKLDKIHVSRLYIEELLQNFLTNAIKYTEQGSITIIIKQKNNIINFAVKDTGIGISKADQKKIFSKFFRSDDHRTRESNGTGLGLYVASKLAYKLNTEIKIESRLNYGSTFSFSIPTINNKK